MSLFDLAKAHAEANPVESKTQLTKSLTIDVDELPAFVEKLESQFDGLELNTKAMDNAGRRPGGGEHDRMVIFAAKCADGQCSVYYSGKVVLTGALVAFKK